MARERRTSERQERVILTAYMMQEGLSTEQIALKLGIGSDTVQKYKQEVKADPGHFREIIKQREAEIQAEEEEQARILSRSDDEIYKEEIPSAFKKGLLITFSALLWWWIPSILFYIGGVDVTPWIYSVNGFIISTLIVFCIVSIIKVSKAKEARENYKSSNHSEQSSSLKKNTFLIACPRCTSQIKIALKKLPPKGEEKTVQCTSCKTNMKISVPAKDYVCQGCEKGFSTMETRVAHQKTCKVLAKKLRKCSHCKAELTLDDNELQELEAEGKIGVNCPMCNGELFFSAPKPKKA